MARVSLGPMKALLIGLAMVGGGMVTACTTGAERPSPIRLAAMRVDLEPSLQLTRPVRVEVVFARTQSDLDLLGGMTAAEWFARGQSLVQNPANGLDPHRLTVEPAIATTHRLGPKFPAAAVMVFADYPGPGAHRALAAVPTPGIPLELRFNADDFEVTTRAP